MDNEKVIYQDGQLYYPVSVLKAMLRPGQSKSLANIISSIQVPTKPDPNNDGIINSFKEMKEFLESISETSRLKTLLDEKATKAALREVDQKVDSLDGFVGDKILVDLECEDGQVYGIFHDRSSGTEETPGENNNDNNN